MLTQCQMLHICEGIRGRTTCFDYMIIRSVLNMHEDDQIEAFDSYCNLLVEERRKRENKNAK